MADEMYWRCPVDGFEASNEEDKQGHLQEKSGDESHKKEMKRTQE